MHRDLSDLWNGLDEVRRSPAGEGRVELVIRRPAEDERDVLTEVRLDLIAGVPGDTWLTEDGDPDRQVTVMNARAVALIAEAMCTRRRQLLRRPRSQRRQPADRVPFSARRGGA